MDSGERGESSSSQNVKNTIISIAEKETAGNIQKIVCSGGYFFVPLQIVSNLNLQVGSIIDDETEASLSYHHEVYTGYLKALDLLSRRSLSVFLMRQKLLLRSYSRDAVDQIIDRLIGRGVLDDRVFAEEYLDYLLRKKAFGKSVIILKLQEKGVPRTVAQDAAASIPADYEAKALHTCCQKLLNRKKITKMKFVHSLSRKGFQPAAIRHFIEENGIFRDI